MGITLREIIFEIGGGVNGGKAFKAVQTGGPSRRLPPGRPARPAHRLRFARPGRHDHGLGRDDRHGRVDLHGRPGPLLPPFHPGGVVRQMRPLPGRDAPDARDADPHHPGPRRAGRYRPSRGPGRIGQDRLALRPRPDLAEPGDLDPAIFPRRIRSPRPQEAMPGPGLPGDRLGAVPLHLPGRPGGFDVHRPDRPGAATGKPIDIIVQDNPLPSICGRVCHHPCERSAGRGKRASPSRSAP